MSGIIFNKINKNDYEFTKNQVKSYLQLNNDSKEEFFKKTSICIFLKRLLDKKMMY